MEADEAFRTLGIAEDAGYDEIMNRFMELSENYASDAALVSKLEEAKEKVLDLRLRARMEGSLKATYDGQLSVEDRPVEPKTPIWEIANEFRKRVILMPSPRYALQVLGLMGGLTIACWIAPSSAGTTGLINTVSGMGFMYNRGEAEVVKDDFGQIGEIRPMKKRPFALTCAITAAIWIAATIRMNAVVAVMPPPVPKSLKTIIRTTLVSLGLLIPALFVRVHGVFPND